ncbi:pyridoxamine 5'-phosphate oxidase family protein [Micromonospora fluostatini]|uniref:Pyridoxamine 5'-phosphate oxidase n=1 Tax=Micromonospora rosaria TaxID=47874 RepID=A0A136PY61_9ACTN|nr:pyridoxamine 5'-phosphate oxidase [Micromonospora rosaria]
MDYPEIVHLMNTDPVAQTLVAAPVLMRLGYVGLDGHPRSVPVSYVWNGSAFVFASPTTAYKVRAIAAHPQVSFTVDTMAAGPREKAAALLGVPAPAYTPLIMLVRGTASIEVRQGLPEEHVAASRRMIGDDAMVEWERAKRAHTTDMAVVTIVPTHVTLCDFITRFPPPVEINAPAHGAGGNTPSPVG